MAIIPDNVLSVIEAIQLLALLLFVLTAFVGFSQSLLKKPLKHRTGRWVTAVCRTDLNSWLKDGKSPCMGVYRLA